MSADAELSSLAASADRLRALSAASEWDEQVNPQLAEAADEMIAAAKADAHGVGAAAASGYWAERARRLLDDEAPPLEETSGPTAAADTVVAVSVAQAALAHAALVAAHSARTHSARTHSARTHSARSGDTDEDEGRELIGGMRDASSQVRRQTVDELGHVVTDRPHKILIRLAITLGVSIAIVVIYRVTGLSEKYDSYSALALFLLSAVVGSSVCTNALCVDSLRVRGEIESGDPLWRILIGKNLAMLAVTLIAGSIVIGVLYQVDDDAGVGSMVDQLLTMTFIWLGVGNVLSVVYPLRAEPLTARIKDRTWKAYLQGFAVSYVVGLAVNLMIYWRLWAKDAASDNLAGGQWGALAAVLASSVGVWVLLSVLAVVCAEYPPIRRALSREMAGRG